MTAFGGALSDPTKIMGARIGAYVVDLLLVTLIGGFAFYTFTWSQYTEITHPTTVQAQAFCNDLTRDGGSCFTIGTSTYQPPDGDPNVGRTTVNLVSVAVGFFNYVLLSALAGGTVGKLLFGLRVVTADGRRAGIGRNLVRWLLLIVDALCCLFLPGLIVANNSKGHRRIGDMAAGTFVVHRSAEGRVLNIPGLITVRRHDQFGGWGPAPVEPEKTLADGGGVDAPVFDPARNTYVRYDPASGVWFQWDDRTQAWVPVEV